MSIVFLVNLNNEDLISCNNGNPRKRDQALQVNKNHFKIAVGLTEDKARALYKKNFKNYFRFDIICKNLSTDQAYAMKKEIREVLSDKLITHNNRANDWIHIKDYEYAMSVIKPYRKS